MVYLIALALSAFAGYASVYWGSLALDEYRAGLLHVRAADRLKRRRLSRPPRVKVRARSVWSGKGTPVGSRVS